MSLHRVLGGTVESLDAQVPLDPAEEQFHLPTCPAQLGNGPSGKEKIVGQEGQPRVLLGIEIVDAPQGIGIALGSSDSGQQNGLVAPPYNLSGGELDLNDTDKSKSTGVLYPLAKLTLDKDNQLTLDLATNPFKLVDIIDWGTK